MKLDLPTIDPDRLGNDFVSWRKGLAEPLQRALLQLRGVFNKEVTIADHMRATRVTFPLIHGTPYLFKSPSFRPFGFMVESSLDDGGNVALPVLGTPTIDYNLPQKKDGWYGLTAQFAPPYGMIHIRKTNTQLVLDTVETKIVMNAASFERGALSFSNGAILVGSAGVLAFEYAFGFVPGTVGSRKSYMRTSASGVKYGLCESVPFSAANNWGGSGASMQSFAAGTSLEVWALQQGVVAGLNNTTGNDAPRFSAHYVDPPADYTARVTGVLWGG